MATDNAEVNIEPSEAPQAIRGIEERLTEVRQKIHRVQQRLQSISNDEELRGMLQIPLEKYLKEEMDLKAELRELNEGESALHHTYQWAAAFTPWNLARHVQAVGW